MIPPRASYRLQFNAGFTFADAARIVPYLAGLGISHVSASPITAAQPGSLHGYDVIDPTQVNPELGGEEGLGGLVAALKAHEMGLIVDVAPNHMGIGGDHNPWWLDVLEHGAASDCAAMFDIDWRQPVLLPVLTAPIANVVARGDLRLVERGGGLGLRLNRGAVYPLRPDDDVLREPRDRAIARHDPGSAAGRAALEALAGRQHYRLAAWRTANDALNWRRFNAINDLAAVRVENPEVFAFAHQMILGLFRREWIDGVRIDDVDALTDPGDYCRRLRAAFVTVAPAREAYIVVAKTLAADERLAGDWAVEGTSGTDFLREVNGLIHVPEGEAPLAELWQAVSGRTANFADEACIARREMLSWQLEAELSACVESFGELARATGRDWITQGMLRRAIEQLLWVFPVVRTYGDGTTAPPEDAAVRGTAMAAARRLQPYGGKPFSGMVLDWLAGANGGEPALAANAVQRFQQLAVAVAAKGVEDCAFYRHGALLSGNELGCDPSLGPESIDAFHGAVGARAERLPLAMLAIASHDHYRGPDARARLAVLGAIPDEWRARVDRWLKLAAPYAQGVHPGDQYLALQTLLGGWREPLAGLLPRLQLWQTKALREAQLRSSWIEPDEAYEQRCRDFIAALVGGADGGVFVTEFTRFVAEIAAAARANSLAQTALHLTVPGVPEIYQGGELADYSMVDPDNRRAIDFSRGVALLAENADGSCHDPGEEADLDAAKLRLTAELLELRCAHPQLFAQGDYQPCRVAGSRARHVVAFERESGDSRIAVAIAVRVGRALFTSGTPWLEPEWWGNTRVEFGDETVTAAQLFRSSPVWMQIGLRQSGHHDTRED